jgi:hypothetical protein
MTQRVPDFADPSETPTPPTPPLASAPPPVRRPVWPQRIVGAIVVVAILAIAAAIILPRQKQKVAPTPTQPSPAQVVTPTPQASEPQPPPDQVTPQPAPQPQGATPTAPTPTPTPAPTPAPNLPNTPQERPLMDPRTAQQVAEQMDATEKGQLVAGLRYMAQYLRAQQFQDPENWELLVAAMATSGLSMIPGGATMGSAQVISLITNAKSGNEAANNLEQYSVNLPSALPQAVKQQIAQVLATATNPDAAYTGVQKVLQGSGIQISQVTNNYLAQAIQQAAAAAQGQTPMPK